MIAVWLFLKTVGGAVFGVLSQIPWKVWAAIAVVSLGAWLWHRHGVERFEAGKAETIAHYEALERERIRLQRRADEIAQAKLDELQARMIAQQLDHENALQEAENRRLSGLALLRGRFAAYVSPLQLARCPDVPRGFLRYWADSASFANGSDPPKAGSPPIELVDEPSGVSIPAIAATVADQAAAFREAVTWGEAWRDYSTRLKTSCEAALTIVTEGK